MVFYCYSLSSSLLSINKRIISSSSLSSSLSQWEHYFDKIDGFGADHVIEDADVSMNRGRRISSMCKVAGTYGEIKSDGIRNAIKDLDISKDDIMYDLGCGTGKVVTQFAYETLCNSCNGIELGERRYKGSTEALKAMQANGDQLSNKIGRYNITVYFILILCSLY